MNWLEIAKFLQQECTIRVYDWQTPEEYLAAQEQLKEIIHQIYKIGGHDDSC